jgi:hypothetical protein
MALGGIHEGSSSNESGIELATQTLTSRRPLKVHLDRELLNWHYHWNRPASARFSTFSSCFIERIGFA